MAKDPVCGMTVDEATALSAERDGETFYFCGEHCRRRFLAQPQPAGSGGGSDSHAPRDHSHHDHKHAAVKPSAAAKYFCPMFQSTTAGGVAGTVARRPVLVGKPAFLRESGVPDLTALETLAAPLQAEGATAIFVAIDGRSAGVLTVADPVKSTTPLALAELRELGVNVLMLTGDNPRTAEAVARKLGIADFQAGVTPHDKHEKVKSLKAAGRIVGMVGDGINDAPALAAADVGVAMGTGTDIAMESAGVTLVKGDLRGMVRAIRLARAMMRNIRQNLFFAFVYNALGIPVAAGVLYPFFGALLSPIIAGAAMSLSSVSVIGNALRLRRQKL